MAILGAEPALGVRQHVELDLVAPIPAANAVSGIDQKREIGVGRLENGAAVFVFQFAPGERKISIFLVMHLFGIHPD
jgi:hypothetical protein